MSPELLRAATGCSMIDAVLFAPWLARGCAVYRIDSPQRLAAFLAQLSHESNSLRDRQEIWGPTPAQQRYEMRADLGNTQPGDGKKFAGKGLIQLTGRANYRAARDGMRPLFADTPDFELLPDVVADPKWAALTACWFWGANNLNRYADRGDFVGLTKRINGGTNGYDDRARRWEKAKAVLLGGTVLVNPDKATQADADKINAAVDAANRKAAS